MLQKGEFTAVCAVIIRLGWCSMHLYIYIIYGTKSIREACFRSIYFLKIQVISFHNITWSDLYSTHHYTEYYKIFASNFG